MYRSQVRLLLHCKPIWMEMEISLQDLVDVYYKEKSRERYGVCLLILYLWPCVE